MRRFLLDASALVKRYAAEVGSPLVNELFTKATPGRLLCLTLGVAECSACLVRKRNGGTISQAAFSGAFIALQTETLVSSDVTKVAAEDELIVRSLPLAEKHAINASDAILLRAALDLAPTLASTGDAMVLVAADQRLIRAAAVESIAGFDPETQTHRDLELLLSS